MSQQEPENSVAHWVQFGQPRAHKSHTSPPKRALATSWGDLEPFSKPVTVEWNMTLDANDITKVVEGFIPEDMDDKWFIYTEDIFSPESNGNPHEERLSGYNVVFVRSWTSDRVAEVNINISQLLDSNGLPSVKTTTITYESEHGKVNVDEELEVKEMIREVFSWILDVEIRQE